MNKAFNLCFVLLSFFLFFAPMDISADELSTKYLQALDLESRGEYAPAAALVKEILDKDKSASIYEKYVYLQIYLNDVDKASASALEANKLYPDNPIFLVVLSQISELKGDDKLALKYYDDLVKVSDKPEYKLARAKILETLERYDDAIAVYSSLLKTEELSLYLTSRGRVQQKLNNNAAAIKDYEQAVALDNDTVALLRLADIYLTTGEKAKAKKYLEIIIAGSRSLILPELKLGELYVEDNDYQKAIELYSSIASKLDGKDRAGVLKYIGKIQYDIGDYDNASLTFEWVSELMPEDTMSAYFAGYVYEYVGKKDKAKEIYEKALTHNPKYPFILKRVAIIYLIDNETDKAIKSLQQIDEIEKDVDYYRLLAEAYSLKKDYNKAILILIEALNNNPTSDDILYSLSMQYELAGEREKSLDEIKKAIKISPNNPIYQNFLGYLYADLGINLSEAHELIKKALSHDPKNPAYIDSLAWVLYKLNKLQDALKYAEEAAKLAPNEKEIIEHRDVIQSAVKKSK